MVSHILTLFLLSSSIGGKQVLIDAQASCISLRKEKHLVIVKNVCSDVTIYARTCIKTKDYGKYSTQTRRDVIKPLQEKEYSNWGVEIISYTAIYEKVDNIFDASERIKKDCDDE